MARPITKRRKKKPKRLAVITDCCTGCAGSPVCVELCPVVDCMITVPDPGHGPLKFTWVDPLKCIGCKRCVTKGPKGIHLEGCPWNAIEMVPTEEVELALGLLPY